VTVVGQAIQSFRLLDGLRAEADAGAVCQGECKVDKKSGPNGCCMLCGRKQSTWGLACGVPSTPPYMRTVRNELCHTSHHTSLISRARVAGQSLEWKWVAATGWAGLPAGGVAGQQLYLPGPVAAVHGQTIPLTVTASYAGGGCWVAFIAR
jgi:hypothetical protein